MKKKIRQNYAALQQKCISIGHSILSAVRPCPFISPLLTGLGMFLYRKNGHKSFVDLISNLWFCLSYIEFLLLKMSAI